MAALERPEMEDALEDAAIALSERLSEGDPGAEGGADPTALLEVRDRAEYELLGAVVALSSTPEAIADRVGAQTDATERVLRFLASRGWFTRKRDGSYRLNARSRALRDDDPQSLRDWVRFMTADWHWDIWNQAIRPVCDGESAATAALGKPFFDWVHEDRPDAGATFDAAMRSVSSLAGPLVAEAVSLDGVASICDVGGGTGRLLRALLDRSVAGSDALDPVAPFAGAMRIGAGWLTGPMLRRTVTWHNGGTGGFRSFVGIDREHGVGVALVSASTRSVDRAGARLLAEAGDRT